MNPFRRTLPARPDTTPAPAAAGPDVRDAQIARLTTERDTARRQAGQLRIHLTHALDARDRLAEQLHHARTTPTGDELARLRAANLRLEDMLAACRDRHGGNALPAAWAPPPSLLPEPSWAEVDAEKRAGDL